MTQTEAAQEQEKHHRSAFLAALSLALKSIDYPELRKAIKSRDLNLSLQLLRLDVFKTKLSEIKSAQLLSMVRGASWASEFLKVTSSLDFSDEVVKKRLDDVSIETIDQITKATQNNLELLLLALFLNGTSPSIAIREISSSYGITTTQQKRLEKRKKLLREKGATSSEIMQSYELGANRLKAERANTLASNESFKAFQVGKDTLWSKLLISGVIPGTSLRKWITSVDEMVCDVCRPMHGQIVSLDGNFVNGNGFSIKNSPAHPSCRCSVTLVT